MTRITRMLATRLRRFAPRPRATVAARTPAADAWARLDASLAAPPLGPAAIRRRELVQEGTRLTITLVGQQGRVAVARILATCDGEPHEGGEGIPVALAVAATLGHTA